MGEIKWFWNGRLGEEKNGFPIPSLDRILIKSIPGNFFFVVVFGLVLSRYIIDRGPHPRSLVVHHHVDTTLYRKKLF